MKKLLSSFEELSKLKPSNSIESSYSDQFIKFESRNVIYSNEVKALFNKIDIFSASNLICWTNTVYL